MGTTLWLTGLPSAGKSTIARGVEHLLRADGIPTQVLDGDEVRAELTRDLGFGPDDRHENVRRIGFVARLLAANGVVVLVPVIAPYARSRDLVRAQHAAHDVDFAEIHVATPVGVCAERDVKGLYARQRAGALTGLTGVDDPYEVPAHPELTVHAHARPIAQTVAQVHAFALSRPALYRECRRTA